MSTISSGSLSVSEKTAVNQDATVSTEALLSELRTLQLSRGASFGLPGTSGVATSVETLMARDHLITHRISTIRQELASR